MEAPGELRVLDPNAVQTITALARRTGQPPATVLKLLVNDALERIDELDWAQPIHVPGYDFDAIARAIHAGHIDVAVALATHGPQSVRQLVDVVDKHLASIHRSIAKLRDAGFVVSETVGRNVTHRLLTAAELAQNAEGVEAA